MKDRLLYHYANELAFIRQLGNQFAATHPKLAGNLGKNSQTIEDPHVARLIEAFALANARAHYKLETNFPTVVFDLINILYPDYFSPIPAMSIVQFQTDTHELKKIPANTIMRSKVTQDDSCYFTTRYPVEVLPLTIVNACLTSSPNHTRAKINLTIKFKELNFNNLRFFVNASPQQASALYELLFKYTQIIEIASSKTDINPILLEKRHLKTVGFSENEGMLPYNKRTFMGYRLLTEFFAFPEKFLFFDIVNLKDAIQKKTSADSRTFEISFILNQTNTLLEKNLNKNYFALNCTPIVNLYQKYAEPFKLTHTQTEYPLIPDSQRPLHSTEIFSIKSVVASTLAGKTVEYQPFFGLKRHQANTYYHLNRKAANPYAGSDITLNFTDLNFNPSSTEKWIINAAIYCTNRDLPSLLPFGGDHPRLYFTNQAYGNELKIKCLTPFTQTKRQALNRDPKWHVITKLALNHMSFTQPSSGLDTLCNILQLYNFDNTDEHHNLSDGLLSLKAIPITTRNPNVQRSNIYWQGSQITLTIDEAKFSGINLYLFGCILGRFFDLSSTINSFTQFSLISKLGTELYSSSPALDKKNQ